MATINKYLTEQLRQRIAATSDGTKFPTEAELCAEFAVSRMTINKVVKELTAEGLLIRNRRRGTFVNKSTRNPNLWNKLSDSKRGPALSAWLEHSTPVNSVFSLRTRVIQINIEECIHDYRRRMWEQILFRVESMMPQIKFKITVEPAAAEQADLILSSLRTTPSKYFSTADNARKAVYERCPKDDYFAPSWTGIMNRNIAACPFAVSSELYVWNLKLLEQYCPGFGSHPPERLIEFVMKNCNWRAPGFPPMALFIFYPLIQWATEGIKFYDEKQQRFDFSDKRIKNYLEFNRFMGDRVRAICGEKMLLDIKTLWHLFNNDQLLGMVTYSSTLSIMDPERSMVHSPSVGKYSAIVPMYLGIGCNCRRVEAAADIIALICGEPGQELLAEHYGNIPALRRTAYSPNFLNNSPLNMKSVLQTISESESLLDKYSFLIIEQPFFDDFARYILGEIELDELYKIIQRQNADVCLNIASSK